MSRRELVRLGLVLALASAPAALHGQSNGESQTDPRLLRPVTLQDCIALALENNLEMRVARLETGVALTGISEAYGAFWPTLDVTAERTESHFYGEFLDKTSHIRNGHAGLTQLLPLGTRLGVGFDTFHLWLDPDRGDKPTSLWTFGITQPLLRGGGLRATTSGIKGARYDASISDYNLEAKRLDIVQRVKAAYFEVVRQAKLVEVNAKAIERDQQLTLLSQSKLQAGLGTKRDMLSAEIQLAQDRGTLVDSQTGHREALDQLTRLLGLRTEAQSLSIADTEAAIDSVEIQEVVWVEKALRDNPSIRAATLTVERTRLDMQVAGNARLPQLDLSANYVAFDDPDINELIKDQNRIRVQQGNEPKELEFTANRGWQALVTFSYPLGNRALGAAYRRSRLVHQQAQRTLEDTERQVALDVRSAVRALHNNVERLGILRKNIEGAKDKLEYASVNFGLGRASNLDVTDAQKDLLGAETDYVNEIIDYRIQLALIEALIGGF